MNNVIKHHTLCTSNYLIHNYLKTTIKLPKGCRILSVHENVCNGIPSSGFGISVLADATVGDFKKHEFLIFPICIPKTACPCIDEYNFLGTTKINTSYYDVFYKVI